MYIYYPSNATVYVRQVGGNEKVTEQWISTSPDQVLILSSSYPPTASTAFISASYAITYTTSMSLADTASYAYTSSVAVSLGVPFPIYGTTASFNLSSSISQGQLILWVNPSSGSYFDSYGQYPSNTHLQQIRYVKDLSGLQRDLKTISGVSVNEYSKLALLYNVGPNNNKTGMWLENITGETFANPSVAVPIYPLWLFVVAKMPSGSSATATVIDGVAIGNRFLCQVGTTPQLFSGASLTNAITGSLTGSIINNWFLQSFKNTAGGVGSFVNTNGTQSIFGNAGGQSLTGYTLGSDYSGVGGGVSILELLLYSNITDSDAATIEALLLAKHQIPH